MDKKSRSTTTPDRDTSADQAYANITPIAPSKFYSRKSTTLSSDDLEPPALPSRPKHGSAHTRYITPSPDKEKDKESTPFREPELVSEEPIPDLVAPEYTDNAGTWSSNPYAEGEAGAWGGGWPATNQPDSTTANPDAWGYDPAWAGTLSPADFGMGTSAIYKVNIDGRNEEEEKEWWNPSVRMRKLEGGMLPTALEESLHHPEHTLFSVGVTPPPTTTNHDSAGGSQSPSSPPPPGWTPPTADEVRKAIPHPNAYYCRKHNGWVLLFWRSSVVYPPFSKHFDPTTLPDQLRRRRTSSCIELDQDPNSHSDPFVRRKNETHHFHRYPKAVASGKMDPPYVMSEWEKEGRRKKGRRKATLSGEVGEEVREKVLEAASAARRSAEIKLPPGARPDNFIDMTVEDNVDVEMKEGQDETEDEREGELLDLYVCCQCSVYVVVSAEVIPGVIPVKYVEELVKERVASPTVGKTGHESVVLAWETVARIIKNRLFDGETRSLPVQRKGFQTKLGWNLTTRAIFDSLGFLLTESARDETLVNPPLVDTSTTRGKESRKRLMRAWVEIGAWLVEYERRFADALKDVKMQEPWVKVESAREMYQTAIGAHPTQMTRCLLPQTLRDYTANDFRELGLTATSYSPDLLIFAYLARCRCDPAHTMEHFTRLFNIVSAFEQAGESCPTDVQTLVVEERSRSRFTSIDLATSIALLGFGKDNDLRIDYGPDVEDEFVKKAWKSALKSASWSERRRDVNEAFYMVACARGSGELMKAYQEERGVWMTPERAYSTLEVTKEVDDDILMAVFLMRCEERPSECDKMREALVVIAEVMDSQRLRQFLETGTDPGTIAPPTNPDMPRGLNQLGNTCYLNSLLQYFYTIKDLRDAVTSMAETATNSLEEEKLTEDDLKRHRVGGRLVTKREILRSKKFVSCLASLFWEMEWSDTPAITPSIELAKLALVTSKDTDEDVSDSAITDSSNDTDATLVEDASYAAPGHSPRPLSRGSSSSVLGKRGRVGVSATRGRSQSEMDVDSPVPDAERDRDYVMVSKPGSPQASSSQLDAGPSMSNDNDGDVEMKDDTSTAVTKSQQPPPLPPRRTAPKTSDSEMLFGRQQDVSECLDNCMFQIETALLKFDDSLPTEDDKTSIVKRLFFGTIRQRLTGTDEDSKAKSSAHEKDDLFSHLIVNVSEEGQDLYDGLSRNFDDVVDFNGKKAKMEVSLVDLPPLLQIQLQRVQFDRETLQSYKSQAYVKFGEALHVDRFLDTADPQKKARSKEVQAELNRCRDRIRQLTQGKHAPYGPALVNAYEFLSQQHTIGLPTVDPVLLEDLRLEPAHLQAEIDTLRARASDLKQQLEAIWASEQREDATYELTSVFIHRGSSPSFGHYFFYARHLPERPEEWFVYNDERVASVSKEEVLKDTTGDTANPYLLVFMRKGAEAVHTVKRFGPERLVEA